MSLGAGRVKFSIALRGLRVLPTPTMPFGYTPIASFRSLIYRLGILKFIEALPDGFDTHLGERGTALSGGQQQRIAIARALYKEPQILILDEATSHLDGRAERTVYNTVELLREEGKTIIVIAHRLGTILNADNVVVLEDGGVVENGPISELMEKDGRFKALWNSQIHLSNAASLSGQKRSAK